jgi:hypothetical protein
MKLRYLLLIFVFVAIGLNAANNKRLVGIWELTEFKLVKKGESTISDEKKLKELGAVWNIEFSEDGSFKQNFNLRNPDKKLETEVGKWTTVKDSLFIELKNDSQTSNLNYTYILLGDVVVLSLENPMTTDKIVTRFRRK